MGLRHMASLSAATIFDQALEFIKQNLVWVIVIAAAVVVLIIVIIVACVLHSKNKKRVPIRKDDEEDGESEARPVPEPTAEESVTPTEEAETPTEASEGQSEEPAEPAPAAEEPIGFANRQSFYAAFYKNVGETPNGYRKKHADKKQ